MRAHKLRSVNSKTSLLSALIGVVFASAGAASAAAIRIEQVWENQPLFGAPIDPNNVLVTLAVLDGSTVPSTGTIDILLSNFGVEHILNGVGQSFSRIVFPDPRGNVNGDMFARFEDGVFLTIGIPAPATSIPQITIRDVTSGVGVGMRIGRDPSTGRPELIRLFSGSGSDQFLLRSTTVTGAIGPDPDPNDIPAPPALGFMLFGLAILRLRGRLFRASAAARALPR